MAKVPRGIILIWPGTNATIPSGFSRAWRLNENYIRGAASAGGIGGQATHTHTVSAHGHIQNAHDHDVTLEDDKSLTGVPHTGSGVFVPGNILHEHTGETPEATGTLYTSAVYLGSEANDSPFLKVIFIESDGSKGIPDDVCMFWHQSLIPSDFSHLAAANARFLKGADHPSGDGGGTGSGSHLHTEGGSGHDHTEGSHSHGSFESDGANPSPYSCQLGAENGEVSNGGHTHDCPATGVRSPTNQDTVVTTQATVLKLLATRTGVLQNTSGGEVPVPRGCIGLWLGDVDDIPGGWCLCDGSNSTPDLNDDEYVEITTTPANYGTSNGGSASHDHTVNSHNHTENAHNHSGGVSDTGTSIWIWDTGGTPSRLAPHTHSVTIENETPVNNAVVANAQSTTVTPNYIDVLFVQYWGSEAVDMIPVRPADGWRGLLQGTGEITLIDMDGGWNEDEHTPYLGKLTSTPNIFDFALARFGARIVGIVLEGSPPATPKAGWISGAEFTPTGDLPVIGAGYEAVAIEVMQSSSMVVAMLLYDDSGDLEWYQTCGVWDPSTSDFDWESPAIKADTSPAGSFQDSANVKGSLRRTPDGGLLFAFIDDSGNARIFRCESMPKDASGTWEEV